MKIDASTVAMQGGSSYQKIETTESRSLFLSGNMIATLQDLEDSGATVELSEEGLEQSSKAPAQKTNSLKAPLFPLKGFSNDWEINIKSLLIEAFLRSLGEETEGGGTEDLEEGLRKQLSNLKSALSPQDSPIGQFRLPNPDPNATSRPMRISFQQHSFKLTKTTDIQNSMQFSTEGSIRTDDGREINFSLDLNMSQSFYEKVDFEAVFQRLEINPIYCDPLVINFNAASAGVQDMKFSFDIDADGESDQISRIMSGSGFLAVDTYGDGTVRDGEQLFGSKSGDGFADLALHDGDNNGWIDESDDIFDKLRVWVHNEDGTDSMFALGELGIGAIYLGNVNTDYCLGNLYSPDGMIRKTGVFLYEDGRAGTVQHVDMAV